MEYKELCIALKRIGLKMTEDDGTSEGAKKGWLSRKNESGSFGASEKVAAHEALANANWQEMEDRRRLSMGQPGGKWPEGKSYPNYRAFRSGAKVNGLIGLNKAIAEGQIPEIAKLKHDLLVKRDGHSKPTFYPTEGKNFKTNHNPFVSGRKAAEREYLSQLNNPHSAINRYLAK